MKAKRVRIPKQVPMTLRAQWGKVPHGGPDIVYTWGQGCQSADAALLHHVITGERYSKVEEIYDQSFVDELKARGYDITTLKFEIKKTAAK